jgi:hypothetical protein
MQQGLILLDDDTRDNGEEDEDMDLAGAPSSSKSIPKPKNHIVFVDNEDEGTPFHYPSLSLSLCFGPSAFLYKRSFDTGSWH